MKRVVVIGLGGIGSRIVEPLARYLESTGTCRSLVLVDGDSYSSGNRDRQRMRATDVGMNKAEAQAVAVRPLFPGLSISAKAWYVSDRNVGDLLEEDDVVFLAVDSHAARKVVSDACRRMRDVLLISAGNELTDGNVQVYRKSNGRERTPPIEKHHPELRFPADRNAADLSCEERAARPGGEQIIFTNLTAAALALNAFYAATRATPKYAEVYFDIITNRARPVER